MMKMRRAMMAIALTVLGAGCGKKATVITDGSSIGGMVGAANAIVANAQESEKFLADRRARGDTLAMSYKDLQGFLPTALSGYTVDGGATGESMNMGAFSMATAEQKFVTGPDSAQARIHITIADYSGSSAGYGMMAPYMAMNMSSEDDHRRTGTVQMSLPTTFGFAEFNKDDKDAKIMVGTRFRYFITVEATGQMGDESKLVAEIATDIAKKFANK